MATGKVRKVHYKVLMAQAAALYNESKTLTTKVKAHEAKAKALIEKMRANSNAKGEFVGNPPREPAQGGGG